MTMRRAAESSRGPAPRVPRCRSPRRRAALLAWLALLASALAVAPRGAEAQIDAFRGWDALVDEDYKHDPDKSQVATFAIRSSPEVRFRFQLAQDAMKRG